MNMLRCAYNALSKLARRVVKMMRLRKDVLLILLSVILTAFGVTVPNIMKANWTPITAIGYLLIISALIFAIWSVIQGIKVIYEKEDLQRKEETKQLIKDTVTETIKDLKAENTKEED